MYVCVACVSACVCVCMCVCVLACVHACVCVYASETVMIVISCQKYLKTNLHFIVRFEIKINSKIA